MASNGLAWTYHLMGDDEKALPWAEKAFKDFPDNPDVLDTLADVNESLGRYDEALPLFERCHNLYADGGNDKGE